MKEFNSVEDILDFAIKDEQRAADLYADLAKRINNREMQKIFEQFSGEDLGHKKKLEHIRSGGKVVLPAEKIQDLKIGDYLVEVNTSRDDLSYQDALIVAMKEEKAAFKLYTDLSRATDNLELSKLFLVLAKEEARHKLRFELEYDEYYMPEN